MAYTQSNEIKTRISLKYDTLVNWKTNNPTLLAGEVAVATIGEAGVDDQGRRVAPPVMMKVGPGAFNELGWTAATAADVYAWAKASGLTVEGGAVADGEYITGIKWENDKLIVTKEALNGVIDDTTANSAKGATTKAIKAYVDAEVQKAVSGGVEGLATEDYVDNAIEALSAEGGAITEAKAGAEATAAAALATARTEITAEIDTDVQALANSAVKANTDAIAAIKDDTDIDSFADVKAELAKKQDTISANTYDAYGSAAAVLGTSGDAATANTVYGAKAAAAAAQSDATIAKTKIETFLGTVTPGGSEELIDTLAEIQAELDRLGGAVELETQFTAKADKVTGATAGNFAGLDENGNLTDSGAKAADFATAAQGAKADTAIQKITFAGEDLGGVTVTDGVADIAIATGNNNGTILIGGQEIAVKGLGSIAYKDETEYALTSDMDSYIGQAVMGQEAGTIAGQKIVGWDNLKTKQTQAHEFGGNPDKILTITQDTNGEISASEVPIQITTSQVTGLDDALAAKANDADLAAVAKTGDISDLTQTENEYIWFNCGTSTTVI